MIYRREIDGLRALSVSVVVLYHFWPSVFKNGFLGVDIFFVISGFLITTYIYEELLKGEFNFKDFYQRRVVRIMPITLFVLFTTTILASFVLIGIDYNRFIESLVASLTFTSNIYFWRDGGYFGQADSLKPLLHIWSLSVEEQFYLFYPVVFFVLIKNTKSYRSRLFLVSILSSVSFLACFLMIKIGGENPAFFLVPFRAWEFGVGSLASLYFIKSRREHDLFSTTFSFVLVILGLTIFSKNIVPGLTLVIGVAFFLSRSYKNNVFLDWFFESKIIRYIGLISFSTYLWHWPLVVFLGYICVDAPSNYFVFSILILTHILSILSYRVIEQPFRYNFNRNTVVNFSFLAGVLLLGLGVFSVFVNPFRNEEGYSSIVASSIQTNYRCNLSDYRVYGASRACLINANGDNNYSIALMGNSHAQMYVPAIEPHLKALNEKGLLIPLNGCLPTTILNISIDCLKSADINLRAILNDKNISTVVIGLTWYNNQLIDPSANFVSDPNGLKLGSAIKRLIDNLEDNGKKVFLIGPIMIPGYDLPSILSRKIKFMGLNRDSSESYLKIERVTFDSKFKLLLSDFQKEMGQRFIMPSEKFCDKNYCFFGDENGVFFSDSNHLSAYGVGKVEDLFGVIKLEYR